MIKSYSEIDRIIKESTSEKKIMAVAAADELHVLEAVCEAEKMGLVNAILVGDKENILQIGVDNGLNLERFEIIDSEDAKTSAKIAVQLVSEGKAHIVMKGLLDTSVFLRAILNRDYGLRKNALLSYVSICEVEGYDRLILLTDPAINIEPSMEEKEVIMMNAVSVAHALGNPCPKVGFVAPIEKVNPKLQSTLDAKAITDKYLDSTDCIVGGPFGLDNAVSEEAARIKGIDSPVAGKADILILNDLGVANVFFKSMMYFSKMTYAGVVVGAKVPIVMTSRADSSQAKLNSIKMSVMISEAES